MTDDEACRAVQTTALSKGFGYIPVRDVRKHRIPGADVFVGGGGRSPVMFIRTDDGGPVSEGHVAAVMALLQ